MFWVFYSNVESALKLNEILIVDSNLFNARLQFVIQCYSNTNRYSNRFSL